MLTAMTEEDWTIVLRVFAASGDTSRRCLAEIDALLARVQIDPYHRR
jgi:hypothetical protein